MACTVSKVWRCDRCRDVTSEINPKGWAKIQLQIGEKRVRDYTLPYDVCPKCLADNRTDYRTFLWIFSKKKKKKKPQSGHDKSLIKELRRQKLEIEDLTTEVKNRDSALEFYSTEDDGGEIAREILGIPQPVQIQTTKKSH